MSQDSKHGPALQLFPFLAVLVCVMGSLIFLLLLTTARAARLPPPVANMVADDDVAAAPADQPIEPQLMSAAEAAESEVGRPGLLPPASDQAELLPAAPEPQPTAAELLANEWQARVSRLLQQREEREAALARQKLLAAAAERRVSEWQAELNQLEANVGRITGELSANRMQAPTGSRERQQLENEILSLRKLLKQAEARQRQAEGKFAIVPFDGKSGTTRRPILIECTATGLKFLSEDVVITPPDIEGFTPAYNPLLAGSLALVDYWRDANRRQSSASTEEEPYVLLLVRPNGTLAYYIAMKFLSTMKQPFGYELVSSDVAVAPPPTDAGAKAACETAVRKLLAERDELTQSISSGRRGGLGGSGGGVPGGRGGAAGGGHGPRSLASAGGPSTGGVGGVGGTGGSSGSGGPAGGPGGSGPRQAGHGEFRMEDLDPDADEVQKRQWGQIERPASLPGRGQAVERAPEPESFRESPTAAPPRRLPAGDPSAEDEEPLPRRGAASGAPPGGGPGLRPHGGAPGLQGGQRAAKGMDRAIPYEQLQRRRWGLSGVGANIGVEKEVVIRVDAQRLIIADDVVLRIPPGANRTELFDHLLMAVDQQALTWGKPPEGFFWVPSLKFIISPGGNQVYERIAPLVSRSGLATSTEFTLEQADGRTP